MRSIVVVLFFGLAIGLTTGLTPSESFAQCCNQRMICAPQARSCAPRCFTPRVRRCAPIRRCAPQVRYVAPVRQCCPAQQCSPVQYAAPVQSYAPVQNYAPAQCCSPMQNWAPYQNYQPMPYYPGPVDYSEDGDHDPLVIVGGSPLQDCADACNGDAECIKDCQQKYGVVGVPMDGEGTIEPPPFSGGAADGGDGN